jgi:hypothetical protein
MMLSAAFVAALGVAASFLPHELLELAGIVPDRFAAAIVQIAGALYVGFALLNWFAKGTLLGGIYGRPIVMANFAHFAMGAIALMKVPGPSAVGLTVAASVYSVFAVWFAYVLFGPGPAPGNR